MSKQPSKPTVPPKAPAKPAPSALRSGSLADGTRILKGEPVPAGLTAKQTASLTRLGVIEKG